MNTIIKQCSKCKEIKDISLFSKNSKTKDLLQSRCKKCAKICFDEYSIKNKNILKEKSKKYEIENKEKRLKYYREYHHKNKEKRNAQTKEYFKTNIGIAIMKNNNHNRRIKKLKGNLTNIQLKDFISKNSKCYWCKKQIEKKDIVIDHYVPLSKGGEHTLSNIVCSCKICNSKKYAKDPLVFANSIGRLL